ncbi:MAG: DUF523 domain-containing protein [Eubacterium sp.]|nr:DUF523 domain-containing protein [Eubacterium sp.]
MKILVSACLMGENCKYNGKNNRNKNVLKLMENHELIPVCPEQPDLIILQSRSPSCGVKQRYDGTFSGKLTDGAGVTARLLMEKGFRCIDVEDLSEVIL